MSHIFIKPYIYGAITAMSNIAWSRLKPSRLGLDSLFDAISAVRPDFPHLPIARRRPPTAYGTARCYAVPYREPLSLTKIRPFCYGRFVTAVLLQPSTVTVRCAPLIDIADELELLPILATIGITRVPISIQNCD